MAASQSQRLRRMAQKASRRKTIVAEKRKTELQSAVGGETREIALAARAPLEFCILSQRLLLNGAGQIVLARRLPSGMVAAGFFLIDVWCLGAKDAFFRVAPLDALKARILAMNEIEPYMDMDPAVARSLLEGSVAYAESLGLAPCESFDKIKAIFGDIAPAEHGFTFGKDGKPLYVSGPKDSPARIRRVLDALTKSVGAEGFEYVINAAGL